MKALQFCGNVCSFLYILCASVLEFLPSGQWMEADRHCCVGSQQDNVPQTKPTPYGGRQRRWPLFPNLLSSDTEGTVLTVICRDNWTKMTDVYSRHLSFFNRTLWMTLAYRDRDWALTDLTGSQRATVHERRDQTTQAVTFRRISPTVSFIFLINQESALDLLSKKSFWQKVTFRCRSGNSTRVWLGCSDD